MVGLNKCCTAAAHREDEPLNGPLIYGYPFPPESSSHLCGICWVIKWIPHGCAHRLPYVLYGVHIGAFCRSRHHDVNVVGLQKRPCWPNSVHCTDQSSCMNSICCLFAKLLTKDWRPGINVPMTNDKMSFASGTDTSLYHYRPLILLKSEGGVSKSLPIRRLNSLAHVEFLNRKGRLVWKDYIWPLSLRPECICDIG